MKGLNKSRNTLIRKMNIFIILECIGELSLLLIIWAEGQVRDARELLPLVAFIHLVYAVLAAVYGILYVYIPYQRTMKAIQNMQYENGFSGTNSISAERFPEIYEFVERCGDFLDERNMTIQNKMAEYLALQNQINPHFLYNALEAIRGDMLEEGNVEIAETLEALSVFFRYSVSGAGKMVTLEDELENIEYYCIVQKYRFGGNIQMEIKYDNHVPGILKTPMPKLILQPVVENAIFHGLERKIGGGKITIQLETTEKRLLIDVMDDGQGIPDEILQEMNSKLKNALDEREETMSETGGKGIALLNIAKRLQILYGTEYGIHIFSKENLGTCVRLTIPLQTEGYHLNYEKRNLTN